MTKTKKKVVYRITTEFNENPLRSLLTQIAKRLGKTRIKISEFQRFGLSGAKLVLANFDENPLPLLIKIAPLNKSKRELDAIREMPEFLGNDCQVRIDRLFKSGDRGALVYRHFGDNKGPKTPQTLGDILFSDEAGPDHELPIKCVRLILDNLRAGHKVHKWCKVDLRKHYEGYFHNYRSRRCIELALGNESTVAEFNYLGADIFNPLVFEQHLPPEILVPLGALHGDLHPDNIVIDGHDTPHLIDYEWSVKDRNILVDFALLENSIRFKHFPRCADIATRLEVDRFLLDKDGYKKIMSLSFTNDTHKHYEQLGSIVGLIRQQAQTILGDQFKQIAYLQTQFITLFGVVFVDGYDPHVSARALGMMARKLVDETSE